MILRKVIGLIAVSAFSLQSYAQKFVDVTEEVGMNYIYPGVMNQEVGGRVTILDVNNDGWEDVFQSGGIFPSRLWINQKGKFVDGTNQFDLDSVAKRFIQGAVAADFDNDGFVDLFLTNMGIMQGDKRPPIMLKNVHGEKFIPVFQEVFSEIGHYPAATFADYNNDGFVDLFVVNYVLSMDHEFDTITMTDSYLPICMENRFYKNLGGNGFVEVSSAYGLNDAGCGLACSFTDFDNDGDQDLLLLNDFGHWSFLGNRLYRNEFPEDRFTDISEETGLYNEYYGMSVGRSDVNNDGRLDYYFTNIGKNEMLFNTQQGFEDNADSLEIAVGFGKMGLKSTSWSGIFGDLDNDGDEDLFVTKGYLESVEKTVILEPNRLFRKEDGTKFEDVSIQSGLADSIPNRGAAFFDFDHDGDLDLVVNSLKLGRSEFAKLEQKCKLFENRTKCKRSIIVHLVGDSGINASAVGARVELELNGMKQMREVSTTNGHSSQSTSLVHFGTGKAKKVSNIVIYWGVGQQQILEELKTGRTYEVHSNGEVKELYRH